jgi:AraC-like DNA-binding protein
LTRQQRNQPSQPGASVVERRHISELLSWLLRATLAPAMLRPNRRRIDWRITAPDQVPKPRLVAPAKQSMELASATSAAMANPSAMTADRLLFRAAEFSRTTIQLERMAIFLLDAEAGAMVGAWGSDAEQHTSDEHDAMYDFGDLDREVFTRAQAGFAWSVYEDYPLMGRVDGETRVIGQGWVACTPIIGSTGPIGILFNDTAVTKQPVDEAKQARTAVLCSVLGQALEPCRLCLFEKTAPVKTQHPWVARVTRLLAGDLGLSCQDLADRMHVSPARLGRVFKHEAKVSIVAYRNELRLARFLCKVDTKACNLLEAALDGGFGSYAQFHRVFRARFGKSPREMLQTRP